MRETMRGTHPLPRVPPSSPVYGRSTPTFTSTIPAVLKTFTLMWKGQQVPQEAPLSASTSTSTTAFAAPVFCVTEPARPCSASSPLPLHFQPPDNITSIAAVLAQNPNQNPGSSLYTHTHTQPPSSPPHQTSMEYTGNPYYPYATPLLPSPPATSRPSRHKCGKDGERRGESTTLHLVLPAPSPRLRQERTKEVESTTLGLVRKSLQYPRSRHAQGRRWIRVPEALPVLILLVHLLTLILFAPLLLTPLVTSPTQIPTPFPVSPPPLSTSAHIQNARKHTP
ncbi:hypothetical protein K432DRAFT_379049 [Lepidopterella palustris CBS 459.81]|uniref:Uncharacterized protein n=1 Tax=Lepidopterella palustris CBS 459.81 TaxID=1314670 RepID=A0A8E2EHX9_9PEZI|nr:hypothetical protein K432DRAFT_379049 [Lepidopterella palustris CBS 459.81]